MESFHDNCLIFSIDTLPKSKLTTAFILFFRQVSKRRFYRNSIKKIDVSDVNNHTVLWVLEKSYLSRYLATVVFGIQLQL